MLDTRELEPVIWAIAEGRASEADLERFHVDEKRSLYTIDRLLEDVEDGIESIQRRRYDDREQILAGQREHVEFFAAITADRAGIRLDHAEVHANAREDALIG